MNKKKNPSAKSLKLAKSLELLLKNKHFIASRPSPNGAERYCVYSPNMSPLMMLSKAEKKTMNDILIKKGERWVVSRSLIRSLHGSNRLKKAYKSYKKQEANEKE